jgi:hypothetical protein
MFGFFKRTPDFLILGSQKAGTTSLESVLRKHPRIKCAKTKEVGFFNRDKFYQMGADWYERQFPYRTRPGLLFFEGTPEYLYYPFVTERIFRFAPQIKLLILLRNPVDRAFSAWNMFRHFHHDPKIKDVIVTKFLADANSDVKEPLLKLISGPAFPEFHDCVMEEISALNEGRPSIEPSFVKRGLYAEQLERFYKIFPKSSLFVLESTDLKNNRAAAVERVLDFLQVPSRAWDSADIENKNVRPYESQMPEPTRKLLTEFFRPHNAKLYSILGRDFGWDS